MKQLLIIPDKNQMESCLGLAKEYNLGFEYNDFFEPDVLDDNAKLKELIEGYTRYDLPAYTTVHGAFFDVLPFSIDRKIREIAELRVEQSIETAKRLGAKAVIFHTNYNPFLNTKEYVKAWLDTNTAYWRGVLARHADMNIYLENMFDTTPDVLEVLSDNLSEYRNYGVCLDYAHAFLSHKEPEVWAKKLGRFVKHIHINDNDGVSDLHLAWGDGKINRHKFYECYEKYMKNATILLETSRMVNKIRSLEMLRLEFLDR
ncbi:MAG: sugar phosphate isomerase/epimerase [Lachnospiraceae bacterium]|nr:sugar phosphate isomerase/epimerase [Lachnospiraceae bacterium]